MSPSRASGRKPRRPHRPEQELRQPGVSSGTSRRSDAGSASGRQEHCTEPRHPDSAAPTDKPATRPQASPPPPPPATPAEQPAWMGWSAEAVPTSSAEVVSHFFLWRKVRKKPIDLPYPANQKTTLQEEDLGYHAEQESQRSARQSLETVHHQTLLNSVLGVNQEDLHQFHYHQQLECQRSAPQSAACTQEALATTTRKHRKRSSALPPASCVGKILGTSMTCTGT